MGNLADRPGSRGWSALSVPADTLRAMGKSPAAALYECSECGWHSTKWAGRCGECQAWGTVVEARVRVPARAAMRAIRAGGGQRGQHGNGGQHGTGGTGGTPATRITEVD